MKPDNEGCDNHKVKWFKECMLHPPKDRITTRLNKFDDLDVEKLQSQFSGQIEGILLDIDDCIAPAYGYILEENIGKIQAILDAGIKVGILSNGINIEERINKIQERLNNRLIICNTGSKPNPSTFLQACDTLGTNPEYTIMIGDDISKDGGALQIDDYGNQLLGGYIQVKPIGNSYSNIPGLDKKLNYLWKNIFRGMANFRNK